jgi:hypothetical protein
MNRGYKQYSHSLIECRDSHICNIFALDLLGCFKTFNTCSMLYIIDNVIMCSVSERKEEGEVVRSEGLTRKISNNSRF